jgi:HD-like signal output (HDOD) protein
MQAETLDTELSDIDREVEKAIQQLGIPSSPTLLTKLVQAVQAEEPDFRRVETVISADVALSASMLKTANSALFGLRHKVTSVHAALAVLGLRNIANLVMGLLLRQAFPAAGDISIQRFWDSSARISLVASRIAADVGVDRYEAHTFALFRDSGMPLMMRRYPTYKMILDGALLRAGRRLTDIERERLKLDHAQVAAVLAREWDLPSTMCMAVHRHHEYPLWKSLEPSAARFSAVALLAEEAIARSATRTSTAEWPHGGEAALAVLDVPAAKLDEWAGAIH